MLWSHVEMIGKNSSALQNNLPLWFICISIGLLTSTCLFAGGDSNLSEKHILQALFANMDVKLKDSAHCDGVGTEAQDQTIGDYLSGFWAFHALRNGNNWIEITSKKQSAQLYQASIEIFRKGTEDNWAWGVSFILDKNRKVDRSSFTCVGGG